MSNKYHSPSPAPTKPTRPSEAEEKAELFKPISEDLKEIGQNIGKLRDQRNMTQEFLGSKLGISRKAVGRMERGEAEYNIDRLIAVCDAFHVPLSEILPDSLKETNGLRQELQKLEASISRLTPYQQSECLRAISVVAEVLSNITK